MDLELALQTFFEESNDLLGEMERILLDAEADSTTTEQLNALFRSMHTIKGSAGLFGLDVVVGFTHEVENVLDLLRDGALRLDDMLTGLLLRCHDHVKEMLTALAAKDSLERFAGTELLEELVAYSRAVGGAAVEEAPVESEPPQAPPEALVEAEPTAAQRPEQWLLSLRFGPDMLRNGMDPSSFIRYLATIGEIDRIEAVTTQLPVGDAFNPETNYLRLEALYRSQEAQQTLVDVFEFAREDSEVHILAWPPTPRQQAQTLASASPEEADAVQAVWLRFGLEPGAEADESEAASDAPPAEEEEAPLVEIVEFAPEDLAAVDADPAPLADAAPEAPAARAGAKTVSDAKSGKAAESKFIKVEAGKLDSLINLIGELVIAGAAANLVARRSQQSALVESTQAIANLIEQIRAGTLSMRMIQIGEIFNRFPRVARDVSRELGKDIQLHISGAETELDKSMVEKLGDPLMHIVRNAIDHGIETTERRLAAGKPAEGHVWLNAYHESGSIVIEVADDGGGLNQQRILAKAVERGLLPADATLPEQDVFRLIFEAGFSTADQVTNISGRGVGMDVVRKSIEQLRGTIDIESEFGLGTTFRIRLPLTLAIIDGFLVEVAAATFVVPLEAVIECIELPAALDKDSVHDCLNLRGELLPLLRLDGFLDLPAVAAKRRNVVVVHYGERKAGLVVDALLGEFQTVIKPLGSLFRHLKAISGSTILGTGEVALILDVPALIHHATQKEAERYALFPAREWDPGTTNTAAKTDRSAQ
ncbi:two-component system chemotaxis sensor kinase CheA [Chromobacterium alkanivorans]|uniref:chemotaxis protein CheA n=1 Tax=Chromobacterium alkanivorans TaxID=1071719 RepID=UPI0023EF11EC|nr:chemotaxis protein CheA [Chromobacterium alkanivorans]MCS3802552.1 two-component system chemotaxis sensor kinase CheA [Chromobacterium alkanivorans]MCS3816878.1 two-component system chemotaxis sensor kinase CheA [Chromobacterium alkanivorans]MCS3871918.1 two-component system chemotaxis sensor kinase CheA [Chromobacterium alkanivorans]